MILRIKFKMLMKRNSKDQGVASLKGAGAPGSAKAQAQMDKIREQTSKQSLSEHQLTRLHNDIERTTRQLELAKRKLTKVLFDLHKAKLEYNDFF